ncbi:metallopeptidase TldD-related protein [Nannocystis pusilla]|uniref:Metalloprotease TldD/E C-terminal domain-containing protein n=1 Tax=Nannocystis pusilla TaxID=889268 RepID=A0ABS7TKV0_9BACT|nr:metallopeptidase TldD-related protein [Nannocystis pusilla]MBZ5708847.1 hypothetical protein [Nannocystis pusilla]
MTDVRLHRSVLLARGAAPRWFGATHEHPGLLAWSELAAAAEALQLALAATLGPEVVTHELSLESRARLRGDACVAHTALVIRLVVAGSRSRIPVVWHTCVPEAATDALARQLHAALASDAITGEVRAAVDGVPLAEVTRCPVVLDPWLASTLVHECIGHSSEADNYAAYMAPAGIQLGHRWTELPLHVVDDPRLAGRVGGYDVDDEGVPARATSLVRDGVWCGLLHSRASARQLGVDSSGHARRVGDAPAIPRMAVTYVEPGGRSPAALLADQADAIYCRGVIGGGSAGREFVLRPAYGLRIRDGRPTGEVLRRFDLVGDKLATLARLAGIADDLTFFDSALGCDKDGQNNLPVSQGAPHLALSAATLRPIARP